MKSVAPTTPYIVVERPRPLFEDTDVGFPKYSAMYGLPLHIEDELENYTGFTIVSDVHLEGFGTATDDELDMIENQLKAGVIL